MDKLKDFFSPSRAAVYLYGASALIGSLAAVQVVIDQGLQAGLPVAGIAAAALWKLGDVVKQWLAGRAAWENNPNVKK